MAPLHILLVVCCIGGISGQTVIFDLGSGFKTSTNFAAATDVNTSPISSSSRKSCVSRDGSLYYSSGRNVIKNSDTSTLLTAPEGQNIVSISCYCNVLSVALQTDDVTEGVWIYTIFLNKLYIIIKAHSTNVQVAVRILYVPEVSGLIIVGSNEVWGISLTDLSTINSLFTWSTNLVGVVDIAYNTNTDTAGSGGFDLFILTGGATYAAVRWTGSAGSFTPATGTLQNSYGHAIDVSGGTIYVLVLSSFFNGYFIHGFTVESFLAGTIESVGSISLAGLPTGFSGTESSDTNGLHICDSSCSSLTCDGTGCTCANNVCGECVHNTAVCQCANSGLSQCCYSTNDAGCTACVQPIDACVFVRNALALRRSGPAIDVVAVSKIDASIAFTRLVDTGRYNSPTLPQNTAFVYTGPLWVNGFSIPVQERGRGRRFGVYAATIDPASENPPVFIPAIATENSGFTNRRYSYSVNDGDDVELKSEFTEEKLVRFTDTVIWRFMRVDQTTGDHFDQVIPPCEFVPNRLTCKLTGVTKEANEGVYESYRPRRGLRNWHPLFYLFVKRCPAGKFGTDCTSDCLFTCDHGLCDNTCGSCICSPGWMGDSCNTVCGAANLVGANCGLTCSDIFSGNVDCKGLLISNPAKVEFACRSGLIPPACVNDCPAGYWGPNCLRTCTVCDPRTGETQE